MDRLQTFIANALIFTLVTIVIAVASIVALRNNAAHAESRLVNDALPGLSYAAEVGIGALRAHIRGLMAAQAKDAASREKYLGQMRDDAAGVTKAMNGYEAAISSPTDRANFQPLQAFRQQHLPSLTKRPVEVAATANAHFFNA